MLLNYLTNRWLKECVQLTIVDRNDDDGVANLAIDSSLVRTSFKFIHSNFNFLLFFKFKALDPNFADSLQILNISMVPAGN